MFRSCLCGLLLLGLSVPASAAELRPVERFGARSAPAAKASPAARARSEAGRQDLRGEIRRLEFEAVRRGHFSPSQRAQQEFRPSPAPSARKLGQARRNLNRLNSLD